MAGEALRAKLEGLPDAPGVYIFLGEGGEVLYVGKASSLRNRVRSYFQPSGASPKAREIVREAVDLDYIVTRNEAEALILEDALIKKHRPRFNTRLRDDKRYPYVKLTAERFPRLVFVRRPGNDGARYFGPFTSAKSLRRLLSIAQKIFPLRTCNLDLDKGKTYRPCLYYHLGKCPGPCTGEVSPEEYHRNVEGVAAILSGKTDELVAHLHQRMEAAAKEERFEEAAKLRDYLRALERLREKQAVALPEPVDLDAVGIATADGRGYGLVLLVRGGRLIGREGFPLVVPEGCSPTEALGEFLDQYYTRTTSIPQEVLLPFSVPEADALARYLAARREQRVEVKAPARGPRRELVAMAQRNAALSLKRAAAEEVSLPRDEAALEELAEALDLPTRPWRIEAFDISNIHGKEATGSMVAFVGGRPRRDAYRRFRVRIAGKPDDYAMMEEVLRRRFSHGLRELQEAKPGGKFSEFPDLVLVDGGKGQLNVALRSIRGARALGDRGGGAGQAGRRNLSTREEGTHPPFPGLGSLEVIAAHPGRSPSVRGGVPPALAAEGDAGELARLGARDRPRTPEDAPGAVRIVGRTQACEPRRPPFHPGISQILGPEALQGLTREGMTEDLPRH